MKQAYSVLRPGVLLALVVWLGGCPYAKVRPTLVHPDTSTVVEVEGRLIRATPAETVLSVNNVEVGRCAGDNPCAVPAAAYPTSGGMTVKLATASSTSDGKSYTATTLWPVIRCTSHWAYTAPTQIPSSQATQTGPNLYQLSDPVVLAAAQDALVEYANAHGIDVSQVDTADEYVEAVAEYVDAHMTWRADMVRDPVTDQWVPGHNMICINNTLGLNYTPGWDFPIPANYTISQTGDPACNCPTDYCGDCEDHAILRAALLRALGFAPECIWDAIDRDPTDGSISHEYNVVVYQGAFRLMDYGPIGSWLATHTWDSHRSYYGWNEDHGPRGVNATTHGYLVGQAVNYKLHDAIQSYPELTCQATPDFNNYYQDTCP